jgi:hypothetical protein
VSIDQALDNFHALNCLSGCKGVRIIREEREREMYCHACKKKNNEYV